MRGRTLRLREEISPDGNLPWSAVKKRNQAIPGPARTGLLTAAGLRPSALSPELPGAEQSGEKRTDKASATSVP